MRGDSGWGKTARKIFSRLRFCFRFGAFLLGRVKGTLFNLRKMFENFCKNEIWICGWVDFNLHPPPYPPPNHPVNLFSRGSSKGTLSTRVEISQGLGLVRITHSRRKTTQSRVTHARDDTHTHCEKCLKHLRIHCVTHVVTVSYLSSNTFR